MGDPRKKRQTHYVNPDVSVWTPCGMGERSPSTSDRAQVTCRRCRQLMTIGKWSAR